METIVYLHLASVYEASESTGVVPVRVNYKFFTNLNWQKLSSGAAMRFFSIALTLAVLNIAGQALALERGDSGPEVANVQRCLQRLGYYNGPVNGRFGPLTESAVRQFQRAKGIDAIGLVGPQTQQALQAGCHSKSNVLKVGSRGSAVTRLQQNLQTLGFYDGPITGYFGQETRRAVIRFQQYAGLRADGIAGASTLQAIRADLSAKPNNGYGGDLNSEVDNYPNALNEGDAGPEVLQLQRSLSQLGYFRANPTGNFGYVTKDAVVRFQRDYGLTPNGIVDARTWTAISSASGNGNSAIVNPTPINPTPVHSTNANYGCSPTSGYICLGETSQRVVAIQQSLLEQGFFRGEVTGYYGVATRDAVVQFQRAVGLNPTGFVDFQTWQALGFSNNGTPVVTHPVAKNRYVVIVPIRDSETLDEVRQYVPEAFAAKSKLGSYVNAGAFPDRSQAEKHSRFLRDRGFDARVEYF